ncbi:MAG: peroxide stress protein YaaA [Gammaproteobacteria bacterium]|nr:peroxide stress protein YaaA [Gammaproteobacteria bacterium]
MLTVISPAKTLDFESPPVTKKTSNHEFIDHSIELVELMRKQSPRKLSKLMHISPKLAELNVDRYQKWKLPFSPANAKQAVLAFKGDVYLGLEAENYNQQDFNFAQKNLRILSGLYGLLKPLDLIQPYRLEMGTKLKNKNGKDLYSFWGESITNSIGDELSSHRNKTLINLASIEYFKSVKPELLPGKVITPVFKDFSNGSYNVLGFFAKKARGYMASFIIKNRISKLDQIKDFDVDGYRFNDNFSTETQWVFTRKAG